MKPNSYDAPNRLTTKCHNNSTWTHNTNSRLPFTRSYVFDYHPNQIYSVAALTNSTGNVVERYTYDPYGKATVLDGSGVPTGSVSAVGNPWTFTGRRLDGETGLMYYRARMFDTGLGRFLGRDPIGYVDGWGLYNGYFVPSSVDPLGLENPISVEFPTIREVLAAMDPNGPNKGWQRKKDAIRDTGNDPDDDTVQDKTEVFGCSDKSCGYFLAKNFKCNCGESIIQIVERWTEFSTKENPEKFNRLKKEDESFVEGFRPGIQDTHFATRIKPAANIARVCIYRRFSYCCGTVDGAKIDDDYKRFGPPDKHKINCTSEKKHGYIKFCFGGDQAPTLDKEFDLKQQPLAD